MAANSVFSKAAFATTWMFHCELSTLQAHHPPLLEYYLNNKVAETDWFIADLYGMCTKTAQSNNVGYSMVRNRHMGSLDSWSRLS